MKKRCLFTVMIMILAFGLPVFAQDDPNSIQRPTLDLGSYPDPAVYGPNLGLGQCAECPKCIVGNIPCPTTVEGEQGQSWTTNLYPFDFDGEAWVDPTHAANGFGSYGYCTGFNNVWEIPDWLDATNAKRDTIAIPNRNCKFLFDVCKCPEACVVRVGERIGIQMIIDADGNFDTVDDGVYFTDPELNRIYFGYYGYRLADDQYIVDDSVPCNPNETEMPGPSATNPNTRFFDQIQYYRSYKEEKKYIKNNQEHYDLRMGISGTPGTPLGWAPTNTEIPINNRVVALESNIRTGGYTFTAAEDMNCVLWIDIPAMRIDPTRAASLKGKTIRLRVRVLFNIEDPTICPECNPPDYCECIIEVGTVCCGEEAVVDEKCMYFPYVLQNLSPWWSGVAISAREALPADAYCKFTVIDKTGKTANYTKTGITDAVWSFMVDDIIPNFGTTFAPGAVTLKVESNYSMHGYSFLTDGTFGAGTLATGCTPGRCAP